LPYEALLEIIHIYLVDVYARDKHPTMSCTRLEAWEASAAEHPPCLPAHPDDLLVLLSKQARRNMSARGIELGGMFYASPEVLALRAELAAKNLSTDDLTVRYNPWNLGTVWVVDPIQQRYLKATAVDPALEGMTEYQWRILKRAVRKRFDRPEHLLSLAEGRNAIRDVAEKTAKKPSRQRRVRATRFLQQSHGAAAVPAPAEGGWAEVPEQATPTPAASPSPSPSPAPVPQADSPAGSPGGDPTPPPVIPDDLDVSDWGIASSGP
jgi:putative transposase